MNKAVFYTINNPEALTASTIYEAVEKHLSEICEDVLPSTLVVEGYSPVKLNKDNCAFDYAFDRLMESLDEEHDPIGDIDNSTNKDILCAWSDFVDSTISAYKVWTCEHVSTTTVFPRYVNGRLIVEYAGGMEVF